MRRRAGGIDRLADVKAHILGFDAAQPAALALDQLAGMKRHRDGRIESVQIGEHSHVERIVVQADRVVLGADDVDADEAGIGLNEAEREDVLREHLDRWEHADDLREIAHGDVAAGLTLRGNSAMQNFVGARLAPVHALFHFGDDLVDAAGE